MLNRNSKYDFDGLVQERHNSIANALELHLSCTNPSFLACKCRADSRFVPGQWETALLCNNVSHWMGANLESALQMILSSQPCGVLNDIASYYHQRRSAIWAPFHKQKMSIWLKLSQVILTWIIIQSGHKFTCVAPAKLLWHVQNVTWSHHYFTYQSNINLCHDLINSWYNRSMAAVYWLHSIGPWFKYGGIRLLALHWTPLYHIESETKWLPFRRRFP